MCLIDQVPEWVHPWGDEGRMRRGRMTTLMSMLLYEGISSLIISRSSTKCRDRRLVRPDLILSSHFLSFPFTPQQYLTSLFRSSSPSVRASHWLFLVDRINQNNRLSHHKVFTRWVWSRGLASDIIIMLLLFSGPSWGTSGARETGARIYSFLWLVESKWMDPAGEG